MKSAQCNDWRAPSLALSNNKKNLQSGAKKLILVINFVMTAYFMKILLFPQNIQATRQ